MRLHLLSPSELNPDQRLLNDDLRKGIEMIFKGFSTNNEKGQLVGPFNAWLRFPKFGRPIWDLVKALCMNPKLPLLPREVAILVVAGKFRPACELYTHVNIAEHRGIPIDKITAIVVGRRPVDLTHEEAIAYDIASALISRGVLPAPIYQRAVNSFGEDGTAELINLVGMYCMISVALNAFDVPVPEPGAPPPLKKGGVAPSL